MNTFDPYISGTSCILKDGGRADQRMTELNALIAAAKASGKVYRAGNPARHIPLPRPVSLFRFLKSVT
jgi:hypothetical protein